MSRKWMYGHRTTLEYLSGVKEFCRNVVRHRMSTGVGTIFCPCRDCNNVKKWVEIDVIEDHLVRRGFKEDYFVWYWHGEKLNSTVEVDNEDVSSDDDNDSFNENDELEEDGEIVEDQMDEMIDVVQGNTNENPRVVESLKEAADTPLYPGCTKYSKLSGILALHNIKAKHGWSDKSFTTLLETLHDILPEGNDIPVSTYYAKKLMCPLGLEYIKIDACPNDCILYRNEYENFHECPRCGTSRYKLNESRSKKKGPSAKVMWYLPIIPRFKRLFSIKREAKNLRWHDEGRKKDGKIRHVADSSQWRNIDNEFPEFKADVRNLRLALCTDGMNPYRTLSTQHSSWPVLLAIYNLPPWLCMKRKYIMLTLLISGPKQPGNDICVYLAPLIEDLKLLWNVGVPVFDAYTNTTFNLRAMVFCTINDFPAYGNLSGYKTKGEQACPICEDDMTPLRLKNAKKNVYMPHRRFLSRYHPYRKMKKQFNGRTEEGVARNPFTGKQVYERIKIIETVFGKCGDQRTQKGVLWKKVSALWELPYWKHLSVRHCLDVMHIEKNVCDAILGTLLNIPGKTKDTLGVRKDMKLLNMRPELWPVEKDGGSKTYLPPACYTMSAKEKKMFCECLYGIKVPTGYCSNLKRRVSLSDSRLVGMKSHDCHVMMQVFLPIALRGILPKHVRHVIVKLCFFFNTICSKVLDPTKLDGLQTEVIETLCKFEMYFPPSFFDIMVHLIVHLVREIKLCGPVFQRYMYPFERHMGTLKDKAKNPARPDASIVQGVLAEEVGEFCAEYLAKGDAIGVPKSRHEGRLQGQGTLLEKRVKPPSDRMDKAKTCVLQHLSEVHPYIEMHLSHIQRQNPRIRERALMQQHNRTFVQWFKDQVEHEIRAGENEVSETIKWLARGPRSLYVVTWEGYDINGYSFYTKRQDDKSVVQNSGVMLVASSRDYASAKDKVPISSTQVYYGVIEEIWELDYTDFKIPLFRCKWADNRRGCRINEDGMTQLDLTRFSDTEEPFILASQAKQVFYVADNVERQWQVVIQGKRRILGIDDVVDEEEYDMFDDTPPLSLGVQPMPNEDDINGEYVRLDHTEGITVNNHTSDVAPQ